MIEPKISVTFILPGSKLVREQAAENNDNLTEELSITTRNYSKKNKKDKSSDAIVFRVRKTLPIRQVIKMSKEAYENMLHQSTSAKYNRIIAKSKGNSVRVWDNMSPNERIKKHCQLIASDLGAISFTYNVLED